MLNIQKYANEISNRFINETSLGCVAKKVKKINCNDEFNCTTCCLRTFNWLLKEYKETILTDEEKKFLVELIGLNKLLNNKKLLYVKKVQATNDSTKCYLFLMFENLNNSNSVWFDIDRMFKRMEVNKEYCLGELEL